MIAAEVEVGQTYDLVGKDFDVHARVVTALPDRARFIVRQLPGGPRWAVAAAALRPRSVDVDLFGMPYGCACPNCRQPHELPSVLAGAGRRDGWPS